MFALLYLGCLYIWYGGTLLNYMKSVWGQIVPEDATPPGQKDDAATPLGHKDEAATPSVILINLSSAKTVVENITGNK